MQSWKKPHVEAVKRILKYVNSTLNLRLFYKKDIHLELHGYANADLGGDLDNCRSTFGYRFFFLMILLASHGAARNNNWSLFR